MTLISNYFLAFKRGKWHIIEPIMIVEAACPAEYQQQVMGLLSKRNGIMTGTDEQEGWFTVTAEVNIF